MTWIRRVFALPLLWLALPVVLAAQAVPPRPSHSFVLSGYGTAGWAKTQEVPNGFSAGFSPILLFSMTDKVFAEAELEFEFDDGVTETALEYATIHYFASDRLTLSAGKILLPFGVFGQRLHPSWINRFASMPPMYGHHGGIPGLDPLLPVIADVGVMASGVAPLSGTHHSVTFSVFLTNGPRVGESAHGDGGEAGEHGPEFGFGGFSGDNNDAKMIGGRLGLVLAPDFEVDASVLRSRWGEGEMGGTVGEALNFSGYNLAAEYRGFPALELRTEWMWLRTDIEHMDGTVSMIETVPQFGGYAQAAYRSGEWEPVVRLGVVNGHQGEENEQMTQYGLGLNYWVGPSVALKAAFEVNRDHFSAGSDLPNNRFLVQWAFGF